MVKKEIQYTDEIELELYRRQDIKKKKNDILFDATLGYIIIASIVIFAGIGTFFLCLVFQLSNMTALIAALIITVTYTAFLILLLTKAYQRDYMELENEESN